MYNNIVINQKEMQYFSRLSYFSLRKRVNTNNNE